MTTLVLTMGRVGSTATFRAISSAPDMLSLHIHHLNPASLDALSPDGIDKAPRHVRDGLRAQELLANGHHMKVVTLVRDVVARHLSVAFARFRRIGSVEQLRSSVGDPAITSRIWRAVDARMPDTWFQLELTQTLGLDVFTRPFPRHGFDTMSSPSADALVMRSDLDNATKSAQVSALLDRDIVIDYGNAATREGGDLHDIYQQFSRTVPWTREDLARMAASPVMRHFFNGTDSQQYVDDWARRLDVD